MGLGIRRQGNSQYWVLRMSSSVLLSLPIKNDISHAAYTRGGLGTSHCLFHLDFSTVGG
jgi:hypothetical protein